MKKNLSITLIIAGFILLGFAIVTWKWNDTAGDLLNKQIAIENQIKKLQVELKEITAQKNSLYVEWINKDLFPWVAANPQEKPSQVQEKYLTSLSWKK